jgi:2-keto-4-pentenoate hydratase/2-oxohepta-3-ene-1,7-dioic acid hydratase in catechol pathway
VRLVRLLHDGDARYGMVENGSSVTLLSDEPFAAWEREDTVPLAQAQLLAPVIPTKIVCVGLNYRGHAEEMGIAPPEEPVLFMKPSTATNSPNGVITRPGAAGRVDYEGELAVVIGRRCRNVSVDEASSVILGYTCGNDVTARDIQARDGQWTRAKGFDGFCPLGPWLETEIDPRDLAIQTRLNGEVVQSARTSDMFWDPYEVVSFVSQVMTMLPGDVVLTGTPAGIGPMDSGDVIEVEIEGIGALVNKVL